MEANDRRRHDRRTTRTEVLATAAEIRGATLVADLLARRWVVPIVASLHDGPRRHFEIANALQGVSTKVLTETLRFLQAEDIVERCLVERDGVVGAGYALTARGDALYELVVALGGWWSTHEPTAREKRTG